MDGVWNDYYAMCYLLLCLDVDGRVQVLMGHIFRS